MVAPWSVAAVVTQEEDQGVVGNAQFFQVVHQVAQGLVHTLHQGGERPDPGRKRFVGTLVFFLEPGIGLERGVHRVVPEIQVEGFLFRHRLGDETVRLQGQRVGQEGVGAVVLVQARHRVGLVAGQLAVTMLGEIAAGLTEGPAPDIGVKSHIQGIGARLALRPQMPLAHMQGAVPRFLQQGREGDIPRFQAGPVPVGRPVGPPVVTIRVDPVGHAVAGGILAGQQRDTRGGADAHGAELAEPHPAGGQALHVGCAVKVVQWILFRGAGRAGKERDRGVHRSHVIDQDHHDVGLLRRRRQHCRHAARHQQDQDKTAADRHDIGH